MTYPSILPYRLEDGPENRITKKKTFLSTHASLVPVVEKSLVRLEPLRLPPKNLLPVTVIVGLCFAIQ
jgi:hypothetical protein